MTDDPMRTWLRRVSLAAGIAFTAHAEYDLARTLGADPLIAAMLPVAVDAYVVAALRWFRAFDITLSLSLMGAAQIAAHLLDSKVMTVNIPIVIVVSLLVPVAIWRTHALARSEGTHGVSTPAVEFAATVERVSVPVDAPPTPEAFPALEVRVPDVPEAVPAGVQLLPLVARPDHVPAAAEKVPVLAAEQPRTRPEVHAEYVPDDADDEPISGPDPLLGTIPISFENLLREGGTPSVRALRSTYSIGQARAQRLRDAFLGVES